MALHLVYVPHSDLWCIEPAPASDKNTVFLKAHSSANMSADLTHHMSSDNQDKKQDQQQDDVSKIADSTITEVKTGTDSDATPKIDVANNDGISGSDADAAVKSEGDIVLQPRQVVTKDAGNDKKE